MSVLGYIFLALEKEHLMTVEEQRAALLDYTQSVGLAMEEIFVEEGSSLKRPFRQRPEGCRLVERCVAGDVVVTMKAAWILNSAREGGNLLQELRDNDIALYCIDLGENITVDEKRRLKVYEGCAGIVQKLLSALAVCEGSKHGVAIPATKKKLENQVKYTGGRVPFGWEVNKNRIFVQNKDEQKIIEAILLMRKDRWSYREISKKMNVEFNIQLSHARVRRILDSDKKKKEALSEDHIED